MSVLNYLPINKGTIAIGPKLAGGHVWMGASGAVPDTWVIFIDNYTVLGTIPTTQQWTVQCLSPSQYTITHVASGLPLVYVGNQLKLGRPGTQGDIFQIFSRPGTQVWTFYDQAHPIMSNISIDAMVPLNGASAIVAASNVNDDAQQFVIMVLS